MECNQRPAFAPLVHVEFDVADGDAHLRIVEMPESDTPAPLVRTSRP